MGAWERFKEGFEHGLQTTKGPDGENSGPNSCMECLILFVMLLVVIIVLGILGVESRGGGSGLPWDP